MSANPEKDPKATPAPPPAPAAAERDPSELSDDDLDKVAGGFAALPQARVQVSARAVPTGTDPLL